jgi:hypothetical protein
LLGRERPIDRRLERENRLVVLHIRIAKPIPIDGPDLVRADRCVFWERF